MIRNSFAFLLFVLLGVGVVYAQTNDPKTEKQGAVRSVSLSFDSDGSYLGVETANVNKENIGKLGLREVRGVAVEKVMDGSPAMAAGIQNGDVILKFGGEDVTSVRKLARLVGEVAPDHQVVVTISRDGNERDLNVTLDKRPGPRFENSAFGNMLPDGMQLPRLEPSAPIGGVNGIPPIPPMPEAFAKLGDGDRDFYVFRTGANRQIGIGVTPLTKQLADHFGVESGSIVNNVRANSPAARAGLKAGDIIVEADGKPVKGDFDLIKAIGQKKEGGIAITFVRDGSRQTISVTPEEVKGGSGTFFESFDAPSAPGKFKLAMPAIPTPLNRLFVLGRVI